MKAIKLATMAIALLLVMSVSAFAQSTLQKPVNAEVGGDDSELRPVVIAKWETNDEDANKPWTQITPPVSYKGTKPITYWLIAVSPTGPETLQDTAYVDVYHPNYTCVGPTDSWKYQVKLAKQEYYCPTDPIDPYLGSLLDELQSAFENELITVAVDPKTGEPYTFDEIRRLLIKTCDAQIYKGTEVIDYHQPCGEFDWSWKCVGEPGQCVFEWTPENLEKGYRVEAYVSNGEGRSDKLVNYFEYVCTTGVEIDFDALNFGAVVEDPDAPYSPKPIPGDDVFDPPAGPACAFDVSPWGTCRYPTIRNIGNTKTYVYVTFDGMGLGQNSDGSWNVQWQSRLGERTPTSIFDPDTRTLLPGAPLSYCNTEQISFWMYLYKANVPSSTLVGTVLIEPEAGEREPFCPDE